ncbi:MAG TPA: protein kinase [Bryobacteraceae bacterium]|nr:protein kinase [Bryobacteraceae bacterium]
MTSKQFRELRATFEDVVMLPAADRERALAQIASRDSALASEVRRMLAASGAQNSLLDRSPVEVLAPPEPAHALLAPGAGLGPYRIEKELGRGGMGVVYLAARADGSFRKRVAIKLLLRGGVDDSFLARFHREREILAQLDHPHIAAILDAGTSHGGDPYFVMEYVDGEPLTAYCRSHALTVDQKLELFLQICDAVQHAHRNLTVHRDLKPSNILVTQAGAVKLLDFGIAKWIAPQASQSAEAPPTVAVLTPEYSSPEQICNRPVTTLADVFSLGILLYEMLTGAHPFLARERLPHEVMRAIAEDDPAPMRGAAAPELQAIVLTALRKEPAWRYPSVEQLAGDVSRYLRGLPVLANGNRWPYRLRKFVRRQWLPLAATALVIVSLAGGIVATRRQALAAERARVLEAQERRAAEQNQRLATEQRALAEARTKDVELERQRERERYREVQSLAASLLFELHDGVRDLAGSSTARRLMVEKAQQSLELLSTDAGNDPSLKRDLAAAYERMGELRVDPNQRGKSGAPAALDAYRRGLALRRILASLPDATLADRRDLALSWSKLGDGEIFAGDIPRAVDSYQQAWRQAQALLRANPHVESISRAIGTIDERRCSVLFTAGKNTGAFEACREGIATLAPLAKTFPEDIEIQRAIAATEGAYANALRLAGNAAEAARQGEAAMDSFDRLQALAPNNAEYRRLAATNGTVLAATLAALGDQEKSLNTFRRSVHSMEIALEIDPSDLNSPLRLAVTLLAYSRRLAAGNDRAAAHDAAAEAVRLLHQTATRPTAGAVEWNEYADALLKNGFPDLTRPDEALQLARNAVSATNRKNPFFLDTMAWAYYRTGDAAKAAEIEREALALVPADAKGGLRGELQQGLDSFSQPPKN